MFRLVKWKRRIKRQIADESGGVLIVALIVLAIGSLMIPPTLAHIGTGTKSASVNEVITARLYSADAGVEYALRYLASTPTPPTPAEGEVSLTSDQQIQINSSSVDVHVLAQGGDKFKIRAEATDTGGKKTTTIVYAHVVPHDVDILQCGVLALGDSFSGTCDISLQGNVTYGPSEVISNKPAQLYADGDICLQGSVDVAGNAFATDTITLSGSSTVSGTMQEGVPPMPVPDMGIDVKIDVITGLAYTPENTFAADTTFTQNRTFNGPVKIDNGATLTIKAANKSDTVTINCWDGLWVTGDLNIEGQGIVILNLGADAYISGSVGPINAQTRLDITGGYAFIVEGNVAINGGANINNPPYPRAVDLPFIVSRSGNVNVAGGSSIAGIFYCPNGEVDLGGNADLYGITIARKIVGQGGNRIIYPVDAYGMESFPAIDAGKTTIEYWRVN